MPWLLQRPAWKRPTDRLDRCAMPWRPSCEVVPSAVCRLCRKTAKSVPPFKSHPAQVSRNRCACGSATYRGNFLACLRNRQRAAPTPGWTFGWTGHVQAPACREAPCDCCRAGGAWGRTLRSGHIPANLRAPQHMQAQVAAGGRGKAVSYLTSFNTTLERTPAMHLSLKSLPWRKRS